MFSEQASLMNHFPVNYRVYTFVKNVLYKEQRVVLVGKYHGPWLLSVKLKKGGLEVRAPEKVMTTPFLP